MISNNTDQLNQLENEIYDLEKEIYLLDKKLQKQIIQYEKKIVEYDQRRFSQKTTPGTLEIYNELIKNRLVDLQNLRKQIQLKSELLQQKQQQRNIFFKKEKKMSLAELMAQPLTQQQLAYAKQQRVINKIKKQQNIFEQPNNALEEMPITNLGQTQFYAYASPYTQQYQDRLKLLRKEQASRYNEGIVNTDKNGIISYLQSTLGKALDLHPEIATKGFKDGYLMSKELTPAGRQMIYNKKAAVQEGKYETRAARIAIKYNQLVRVLKLSANKWPAQRSIQQKALSLVKSMQKKGTLPLLFNPFDQHMQNQYIRRLKNARITPSYSTKSSVWSYAQQQYLPQLVELGNEENVAMQEEPPAQ